MTDGVVFPRVHKIPKEKKNAEWITCPLRFFYFPTTLQTIGNYAFDGRNIEGAITIPEGVTTIGEYAFRACNRLATVTLGASLTSVGYEAFNNCPVTAIYVNAPAPPSRDSSNNPYWYYLCLPFDSDGYVTAIDLTNNGLYGQLPAGSAFTFSRLATLHLDRNAISGDLAGYVAGSSTLRTLSISHCLLTDVLPASITNLDLSSQCESADLATIGRQDWAVGVFDNVVLSSLVSYNHAARDFSARPDLRLYTIEGNSYVGTLSFDADLERYVLVASGDYRQTSGAMFVVRPYNCPAADCRMRATISWTMGDANGDAAVDVLDAQHTLNYILGTHRGMFNRSAANTYADALINVQDVVATVGLFIDDEAPAAGSAHGASAGSAYGAPAGSAHGAPAGSAYGAPAGSAYGAPAGSAHGVSAGSAYGVSAGSAAAPSIQPALNAGTLSAHADGLYLDASTPVAALDVVLSGVSAEEVQLMLRRADFQMITRNTAIGVRIVIISTNGTPLPDSNACILRTVRQAEIEAVDASDADTLSTDADVIYDLSGRRVSTVRSNGTSTTSGVRIVGGRKVVH